MSDGNNTSTTTTRSTPALIDFLPHTKRKSILKKETLNRNEYDNLLDANRRNVYYKTCQESATPDLISLNKEPVNDRDNYNITADPLVSTNVNKNNNVLVKESKTGKAETSMHITTSAQQQPVKQLSSDSYTDDSQLNTFDKSEDEFLFSDSVAIGAFDTDKANIWQNADIHGIITWQTDTSPSNNLENEENCFCSFSLDPTPPEEMDAHGSFNRSSSQLVDIGGSVNILKGENNTNSPNNRYAEMTNNSSNKELTDILETPSNKIIPLDQLMQRLQRTPSCETSPKVPSPGASG